MIYLFGKGKNVSIIYDATHLPDEIKKNAVVVEALPPQENKEGHSAVLYLDEQNKPYWEYLKERKDTLEELVSKGVITSEDYKKITGKDFTL
jgi:hypothetical protein